MVAYSFAPRFSDALRAGLAPGEAMPGMKRQTVRAHRKRHARPGEELQLYTGMRTRACTLVGRARCVAVEEVRLLLTAPFGVWVVREDWQQPLDPAAFARDDGFADWAALTAFWAEKHPAVERFDGVLIRWDPAHA